MNASDDEVCAKLADPLEAGPNRHCLCDQFRLRCFLAETEGQSRIVSDGIVQVVVNDS